MWVNVAAAVFRSILCNKVITTSFLTHYFNTLSFSINFIFMVWEKLNFKSWKYKIHHLKITNLFRKIIVSKWRASFNSQYTMLIFFFNCTFYLKLFELLYIQYSLFCINFSKKIEYINILYWYLYKIIFILFFFKYFLNINYSFTPFWNWKKLLEKINNSFKM